MLYLLLYAVLVMGTFAIVTVVGRTGDAVAMEVRTGTGELALTGCCWFSAASRPSPTS